MAKTYNGESNPPLDRCAEERAVPHKEVSMHGQISWHELTTPNTDDAMTFYGGLFGWTFDSFGPPGAYWLIQNAGDAVGGLMTKTPETLFPQGWLFYVDVDDVDEAIAQATKFGGTSLVPPFDMPGVGRIAVIQDPAGATVGVMTSEDTVESPMTRPKTGEFCWRTLMTSDADAARRFYHEVFGWHVRAMDTGKGKTSRTFMWKGIPVAALEDLPADMGAPPHWGMAVEVEDCAASASLVEGLGGRLLMKPTAMGEIGKNAVLMDNSGGAFLSLFQSNIQAMDRMMADLNKPGR